jgi:hypothetical protein
MMVKTIQMPAGERFISGYFVIFRVDIFIYQSFLCSVFVVSAIPSIWK